MDIQLDANVEKQDRAKCSFSATPLLPNECKRHAGERALRSLSFGFGRL
jgi:hypothetical protein